MIVKSVRVEIDQSFMNYIVTTKSDADRRSEVIMVLPRPGRKILALTKSFYPEGTYNLPSGGIKPGESPEEAFFREVAEETGLPISFQAQIGRIEHHCYYEDQSIDFTSHVMLGTKSSDTPQSTDEVESICGYVDASAEDLLHFRDHMTRMTGRWVGFGRFRATALDFVAEYLTEMHHS